MFKRMLNVPHPALQLWTLNDNMVLIFVTLAIQTVPVAVKLEIPSNV